MSTLRNGITRVTTDGKLILSSYPYMFTVEKPTNGTAFDSTIFSVTVSLIVISDNVCHVAPHGHCVHSFDQQSTVFTVN